ncbi:MAG TPA: phenylalanine--tRNA ligase subunit alpha, partial [Ktedonobacteraceae bacterium]
IPHLTVSNFSPCWFKMGGTTEHAGNFVPVDEHLVSFFVSLKQEKGRNHMSNIVQQDILQQLQQLQRDAQTALAQANTTEATREWYSEYLSRKGRLTSILRNLGSLSAEERPLVGKVANEVKAVLENALQERQAAIAQAELEAVRHAESVDVTLPGRPQNLGKLHITTRVLRDIYAIFTAMGFQIYDSPDVETDEYNFQLLNMPPGHPARDMWDTFYTTTPGLILRTHTSPGQIHAMREYAPEPIRVILPGKCYRYEQVTARSESMFYQVEGLAIGKHITFSDLKGVLINFANQMYGEGREARFRKSYFPFTEPSVEMDIACLLCDGKGCPICKYTGWLEILGAGAVHPRVLEYGGYDPAEFSGFAFGMGPERMALQKYGIDDIRYFYTNDARLFERI